MSCVIEVKTGKPYSIHVGSALLANAGELMTAVHAPGRIAVVTDSNVAKLHLPALESSLKAAGFAPVPYVFPAGEASKTLATYGDILQFLAENRFTRTDVVIALGGGVTGDLTGFAAATYLRGIRFIQIPTTLLAMVDSSVGGKTGVDLPSGKNLVGAFHQPSLVICDTAVTATLPKEVFADGVAEALKTAVLRDATLFALMEQGAWNAYLDKVIGTCIRIKADVVEADEFEQGERKLLNLGHTLGHAIEKCSDYAISHGHAVAMGLAAVTRAAVANGLAPQELSDRISNALQNNNLPVSLPLPMEELLPAIASDKKRAGSKLTLVVPLAIGNCTLCELPLQEAQEFLRKGA